ncbi:MAG: methionyl-tRNA formyltransferase, partial [Candidatus Spechtbacteria bacterium]|nr:methionyl-tRNA formyltransferase [Candidatus Spechtbacteria bacterium]
MKDKFSLSVKIKMDPEPLKIVFFGTPEFGRIILERLIEANYKPILIVTAPDKPVGRKQKLTPSPVKVLAGQHKIPILQPQKLSKNTIYDIQHTNPGLFVVAAYGKIIPKKILAMPKYGALNVHPSLLPRWRGPSPIQYAILNSDKEAGITIMLMDEKLDHGPLFANEKLKMKIEKFTAEELSSKLAELGAELLIKTIPQWVAGE